MSWLYEIPQFFLALFCITLSLGFGLGGLYLTRPWLRGLEDKCNELAVFMGSSVAVFYAILLALVAVQVSETFADMEALTNHEATRIADVARDTAGYPPEFRDRIRRKLVDYIELLMAEEWPAQKRGSFSPKTTPLVTGLIEDLVKFEPQTEGQKIVHQEVLRVANEFISYRRARLQAIDTSLLDVLWMVVLIGAGVSIAMTWLYYTPHTRIHALTVGCLSFVIGLSIFVIVDQDHPFQGVTSVSVTPYELVLDTILRPLLSAAGAH